MNYSHRQLCFEAAKYLKNKGLYPFHKCKYVVCELERIGESPDAYGFGSSETQLIEVKVSRSDFLSDKNKHWRKYPQYGLGTYRSYLCPEGMIKECDLPDNWGLLWINDGKEITKIVEPKYQISCHIDELRVVTSILRREGVKPQIFNYKKYKADENNLLL